MADDYLKPIRLSEQQRTKITNYLTSEVESVLDGRQSMVKEWERAIEDYEAEPSAGRKDFPFEGACNIVIPTIATTVDAIFARELNTIFSLSPLWSIKPMQQRWVEHAKPTENFLEWAQSSVMSMFDVCWSWYFEATLIGSSYVKMPYVNDVRRQLSYLEDGRIGFEDIIYHAGPQPKYIPIQDMLLPDGDWTPQECPWIGNFFRLTKSQLIARGKQPYGYDDVSKVRPLTSKDQIRTKRDQLEGFIRTTPYQLYELAELWVDWDINGDGVDEQLVITWDNEDKRILRAIYNQYLEGYRPYHETCFMRRHGRNSGIGIARMLRQIAEGITTQYRQFIDNATLANTRIWKARRNSGIKQGQKIYPGKVLFLNDPDDLKPEQLGDIYNSQMSVLGSLRESGERRTGLSDVHLGIESPRVVNRMPATNMLSILQEGNKRFDLTIRDMRYQTSKLGEAALALYQQFRPTGVAYNVLGPDGDLVEEVWRMPRSRFKGGLGVIVSATAQSNNRELEKQSLMQMIQAVGSYYERMFQLSGMITNPQTPGEVRELAYKVAHGGRELMKRLLQAYAMPDSDSLLPDLAKISPEEAANAGPRPIPLGGSPQGVGLPGAPGGGPPGGANPAIAGIMERILSGSRLGGSPPAPAGVQGPMRGAGGGRPNMGPVQPPPGLPIRS